MLPGSLLGPQLGVAGNQFGPGLNDLLLQGCLALYLFDVALLDEVNDNKRWINVKIRSNRFDDKVTINGVSYGSTPVEIMLPAGQHQLMVEKPGYRPYSRQMIMTSMAAIGLSGI